MTADTLMQAVKTSVFFIPKFSHVRDLHRRKSQTGQVALRTQESHGAELMPPQHPAEEYPADEYFLRSQTQGPSRACSAPAVLPSTPDTCGPGLLTTRPLIFFPAFPQLFSSNFSSKYPLQSHCYLPWNDILLANLY